MGLDKPMALDANRLSSLGIKEPFYGNICGGSQQEAQGSDDLIADPSKGSNATLCSLPNAEENIGPLNSGQKQMEPIFSLHKQTDHVVHFNPAFKENSFVNVEGQNAKGTGSKGGWKLNKILKGLGTRFKNFENTRVSFTDSMKKAAELIASEIDGKSAKDLSRVSGNKADLIIAKLGWDKSYRVQANGFSRGIWISWKNSIDLKTLWNDLSRSVSIGDDHWLAIGDFMPFSLQMIKKGGYIKGRRCQSFGKFMDKAQLHDLRFQGPPFTWHHGNLSERLDRAALKAEVVNFFQNLYGENPGSFRNMLPSAFSGLSTEDADFLERNVMKEEIKVALFDMAPLKAPSSYGFQEVLHSMRTKKSLQWIAIKIDLEKTYDKVLWNGAPTQKFRLVKGIRQGCPLSPDLFVLCMEWLRHRFHESISAKE
ncbi:hypothetical protein J1N35_029439 [Gossypium stocksii]|uniref:Reverse transcriptase domain-containing protein n=1 Tax=Gossypium stocksii TaxID=47602 RepID=A0A9D3UYX4_9ROSI|nr:hypothetical protein J1N35_029439 [Gossypium stocksii]